MLINSGIHEGYVADSEPAPYSGLPAIEYRINVKDKMPPSDDAPHAGNVSLWVKANRNLPPLTPRQPLVLVLLRDKLGGLAYIYGARVPEGHDVYYDMERDNPRMYAAMPEDSDLGGAKETLYDFTG
ncbi:MAG: hypothetical protein HY365_00625 [Candidatus Aenigmarchaeota archaeon]|nr:hypothetical protein [Candidatus Aenigmarchaeota archaeon]